MACRPSDPPTSEGEPFRPFAEVLRIGSWDDPHRALEDIAGLTVDEEGSLYLLERRQAVIRVFSPTGDFLRTLGARGAGPGEFLLPVGIGWRQDHLWVSDAGLRRITFLEGPDREPATVPQPAIAGSGAGTRLVAFLPLSRTRFLAVVGHPQRLVADGVVTTRAVLAVTSDGTIQDTIAALPIARSERIAIRSGDRVIHVTAPPTIRDAPRFALHPEGDRVTVVEPAVGPGPRPSYRITLLTCGGDTVWSRERPSAAVPVTPDFVRRVMDETHPPGRPPALTMVDRSTLQDALPWPEFLPAVSRLVVDERGRSWVGREDDLETRTVAWDVFDRSGELLFRTELPRGVHVLAARGGRLYGRMFDDSDVPYVVVYGPREDPRSGARAPRRPEPGYGGDPPSDAPRNPR